MSFKDLVRLTIFVGGRLEIALLKKFTWEDFIQFRFFHLYFVLQLVAE